MKARADYPKEVDVVYSRKPRINANWFQDYRMRRHNDFYEAHPELWSDPVTIKIPTTKNFTALFKAQAAESFMVAMPEYNNICDLVSKLKPKRVLDIACGVGRSSVYLFKRLNWKDTQFVLVDGNIQTDVKDVLKKNFGRQFKNTKEDLYSNFDCIKDFCNVNGLKNYEVEDCLKWKPSGTYDLVYSTLAFGYHWDFNIYLSRIYNHVKKGGLIIFGTRGFDSKQDGGEYTNQQLAKIDTTKVKVIRDVRVRENLKSSLVVLKRI